VDAAHVTYDQTQYNAVTLLTVDISPGTRFFHPPIKKVTTVCLTSRGIKNSFEICEVLYGKLNGDPQPFAVCILKVVD